MSFSIACPNCPGESCSQCNGAGVIRVDSAKPEFNRDKKRWTPLEDHILECLYRDSTHRQLGVLLGRGEASVRNRCHDKNWKKQVEDWTPAELQELTTWYAEHNTGRGDLELTEISLRLGRQRSNVCRKAKELGLTDSSRPFSETLLAAYKESCQGQWDRREHPKGMLGKTHSIESKKKMSVAQVIAQNEIPEEKRRAIKGIATKVEQYGTGSPGSKSQNAYSCCKRGAREDLGEFFFRSSWEANYARYLNLLIERGLVERWEYEVDTFVFHGEVRGAISYLPDFKVWLTSDSYEYHEVKGWMDSRSKTKLKRMGKHYPNEKVIVIGQPEYKILEKEFANIIKNWELPE